MNVGTRAPVAEVDAGRRRSSRLRLRVAWMYYAEDMTQGAIAEKLGIGRVTVTRLLADARALHEVSISLSRGIAELPRLELALEQRFGLNEAIVAPLRGEFPEAELRVERLWDYPGLGTPSDAGVVNFVKSLTGANGTMKVAFGTEGGLFDARLGIPTVICGPGSMAQGHKPDEFVSVEQMERCQAMLSALIARLQGGL